MKCPFCKQDKIFVGVHDDEGNYHGRLGCDYEADPWSGLSYALHHEGWGECIMCTDDENEVMGGVLFDTAEEAQAAIHSCEGNTAIAKQESDANGELVL